MYQPLVSIILPVYNGTNYLSESIESALNQTYNNIEVIVVNDGSTDNRATEELALSYGDRIRYFYKQNGGSSSALNEGIRNMKGEWFSWLSHDDLYYSQKIEKQIHILNKKLNANPKLELDKQVVYCDSELINDSGKILSKSHSSAVDGLPNIEIIVEALKNIKLNGCSFLLPRSSFDEIGKFDEKLRLLNDFEFWYRLLFNRYCFNYVPEVLVKGRIHRSQVSRSIGFSYNNKEQDQFWSSVIDWVYNQKEYRKAEYFFRIGKYALYKGRDVDSDRAFKYAVDLDSKYKIIIPVIRIHILFYRTLRNFAKRIYIATKLR